MAETSKKISIKKYSINKLDDRYVILSFDTNHHIKMSNVALKILSCFHENGEIEDAYHVALSEGLQLTLEDVKKFYCDIIEPNDLEVGTNHSAKRESLLWVKWPLGQLKRCSSLLAVLQYIFAKPIILTLSALMLSCICYSVYRVYNSSLNMLSLNSGALLLVTYFDMAIHELGHATAAYREKIELGEIGIGVYLFYPVMYVDISNIWRLNGKKRALIDAAGVYMQLLVVIPFTLLGIYYDNTFFYIANTSLFFATLINLLPIMKLDGYWFFCDLLGIENISQNAVDIIKHNTVVDVEKKRRYYLFSMIYVLSIGVVLLLTAIYGISVFMNYNQIIDKFILIKEAIISVQIGKVLYLINDIFLYLLPIAFSIFLIIKGCCIKLRKKEGDSND